MGRHFFVYTNDFGHIMKVNLLMYVHYKNYIWTLWRSRKRPEKKMSRTMNGGRSP